MNPLKRFTAQPNGLTGLVLGTTILVVSACSGSGSSDTASDDLQTSADFSTSVDISDGNASNEVLVTTETDSESDVNSSETTGGAQNEAVNNDPVVEDPLIQNRVSVTFEMTVPAYQSDELSVELIWGEFSLAAMWVGDEYWSANGNFPTDTQHPLTVTFYDNNGALELARFSQEFKTGSNATESVQIPAEQFDANQFDTDKDGVSNLAELISGTNPLIDEDSELEIIDIYYVNYESRVSVSQSFESRVSEERPYFDNSRQEAVEANDFESFYNDIDIDTEGNGTLTYSYYKGIDQLELTATRTHSGNTITWEGDRRAYDGDYGHRVNVTNTVTVVDETTREYVEEIVGSNVGTYDYRWETSSQLTGRLIDGSSLCKPVAGTVLTTSRENHENQETITTISKALDDPYWKVVHVKNATETIENYARELGILRSEDPESANFICDFVDI